MFRLDRNGEVVRLLLERPEARNAIFVGAWRTLAETLGEVEASPARLLVVGGAGGAFCAGADLADFPHLNRSETARLAFRTDLREALDRLRDLPIPTIALVEGACYGAGVALAMACDLRLVSPSARFAITPAKIGISYPQEDIHRLVELVGSGHAGRLLFTAASIDAAEALRIGLAQGSDVEFEALSDAILTNDRTSLVTLKRGLALARIGRRSDAEQDRRFDSLIAGESLAQRLEALGRK